MKLTAVQLPVHVRVGKEELRRAAFDNYVEHVRTAQLIERLGGQNHGGICFPPGLQRLHDVSLNAWVLEEDPCLIDEESFEGCADLPVGDDCVRSMQDVKEQGFEKLGILTHLLEVEALEPGERNRVFWVVKEEPELASLGPLREPVGEPMSKRVGEDSESSQGRVNGVKILNLLVEVSLLGGVQLDRC